MLTKRATVVLLDLVRFAKDKVINIVLNEMVALRWQSELSAPYKYD